MIKTRKIELGIISGQKVKLPKNLVEIYSKELEDVENIIIFIEFLKEFVCIFSHKDKFENLVEEMYGLYSNMLDEYYDQSPQNDDINYEDENENEKNEVKKIEIDDYFNGRISTINEIEEVDLDFHY